MMALSLVAAFIAVFLLGRAIGHRSQERKVRILKYGVKVLVAKTASARVNRDALLAYSERLSTRIENQQSRIALQHQLINVLVERERYHA